MVVLRPFRGWRYDLDVVGDPALVLCPPYDLITLEMQESLRRLSPYNVVHLEAGEGLDWDAPAHDQYSDIAALFRDWASKGVLRRDTEASYYISRQVFLHQVREWSRLGLTACVGLEPYESRHVLPHEYTQAPAIRDRSSAPIRSTPPRRRTLRTMLFEPTTEIPSKKSGGRNGPGP